MLGSLCRQGLLLGRICLRMLILRVHGIFAMDLLSGCCFAQHAHICEGGWLQMVTALLLLWPAGLWHSWAGRLAPASISPAQVQASAGWRMPLQCSFPLAKRAADGDWCWRYKIRVGICVCCCVPLCGDPICIYIHHVLGLLLQVCSGDA